MQIDQDLFFVRGLTWKHVLTSRTKRVFWTDVERAKIQNDLSQPHSPFVERDVISLLQ